MTCEDAMEKISAMLDGELDEAEQDEVQAHLNECARCRAVYAAYQGIDDALLKDTHEPPEALRQTVMREIRQEKKQKANRRFKGVLAAALAAAAVFIALCGAGVITLPGVSEEGQATVAVGQMLRDRFDRPRQKKQAQKLADSSGCAVLALWTKDVPAALSSCAFTQEDSARIYETDAQTAQEIALSCSEEAIWFSPEESASGETALIVVFS